MNGVTRITSEQNVMMITFTDANIKSNALARELDVFAKSNIVVDMICQSTPRADVIDFSFTASYTYFNDVLKAISSSKTKAPLLSSGFTKINLYGEEMVVTCGVAAKALNALSAKDIEIFMITTSDLDISLLVRAEQEDTAINTLSKEFSL